MEILIFLLYAAIPIVSLIGLVFYVTEASICAGRVAWKKWVFIPTIISVITGLLFVREIYFKQFIHNKIITIALLVVAIVSIYFAFLVLWLRLKSFRIVATVILTLCVLGIPIVLLSWIVFAFVGKTDFQTQENYEENAKRKIEEKAVKKNRKRLKREISKDNLEALCDLADSYLLHPNYSYKKNKKLYMKAAKKGSARAQFWVSEHANGYIKANEEDRYKYREEWDTIRKKWLKKSVEQEYPAAMYKYSQTHNGELTGDEVQKLIFKAAEKECAEAQFNLACQYLSDDLNDEALYWFTKSAENGYKNAQYELACCYIYGVGTKKDLNKVEFWLKKSAEQDYFEAMVKLSNMYSSESEYESLHNEELSKYWKNKYLATYEYKRREEQRKAAEIADFARHSAVDYGSISRRTQEILGNTYGGGAIVSNSASSDDIWDEIDTANKVSKTINDPDYKIW